MSEQSLNTPKKSLFIQIFQIQGDQKTN